MLLMITGAVHSTISFLKPYIAWGEEKSYLLK